VLAALTFPSSSNFKTVRFQWRHINHMLSSMPGSQPLPWLDDGSDFYRGCAGLEVVVEKQINNSDEEGYGGMSRASPGEGGMADCASHRQD